MDDPAEALRAYIEEKYSLATETVTKTDIAFQTVDYNLTRSVQSPHVIVQLSGFQRKQQAESALYDFTFLVQVSVFPKFRQTQAGVAELQALYWAIVNHIKVMLDAGTPSGWEYAYVDAGANAGIAMGTIPDEYVFNLTVKACIAWSS